MADAVKHKLTLIFDDGVGTKCCAEAEITVWNALEPGYPPWRVKNFKPYNLRDLFMTSVKDGSTLRYMPHDGPPYGLWACLKWWWQERKRRQRNMKKMSAAEIENAWEQIEAAVAARRGGAL